MDFIDRLLPYHRVLIVGAHFLLVGFAYWLAFAIRFDFQLKPHHWDLFFKTLPLLLFIKMTMFWWFRLFSGLWRYASIDDLIEISKATTIGSLLFLAASLAVTGKDFSRSVYLLDWLISFILIGGVRVSLRLLNEIRGKYGNGKNRPVIIIGANDAGEMLIREIERNNHLNYKPAGIVDNDPTKLGARIHGIKVMGLVDELPRVCEETGAKEVVVAASMKEPQTRRAIIRACLKSGLPFKRIPVIEDILQGRAKISQFQEVYFEDLIERAPSVLSYSGIGEKIRGRCILVTGAGGSIGSELCRQLAKNDPELLIMFERGESNLYFTHLALKDEFPDVQCVPVIGDILDRGQVRDVIRAYRPQVVYHAAAYKHVPLMEVHPLEAVENNVFGTENVALEALAGKVEQFVFISTDKAVNPVGMMGRTKNLAETLLQTLDSGPTNFIAVRFGNVIGSQGSVLPLFYSQIIKGGPVTITHPDAVRYFMNVSEAAQLVIYAGAMGKMGEVFYLDMGTPVKIMELANSFIRSLGLEPGQDIDLEVTGLRPGERLNEELVVEGETILKNEDHRIIRVKKPSIDKSRFAFELEELRSFVKVRERERTVAKVQEMVERNRDFWESEGRKADASILERF